MEPAKFQKNCVVIFEDMSGRILRSMYFKWENVVRLIIFKRCP
jgi:hypothetical protein